MGRNRQVERRGTTDIRYRWPGARAHPQLRRSGSGPRTAGRLARLESRPRHQGQPGEGPVRGPGTALADGKTIYMAVPMLASEKPFNLLDPEILLVPPREAATKETAARVAPLVALSEMRPVDLVVAGSVAVNHQGVRLGKGAGHSDIEVALLTEGGLLRPETVIVTMDL